LLLSYMMNVLQIRPNVTKCNVIIKSLVFKITEKHLLVTSFFYYIGTFSVYNTSIYTISSL